MGIGDDPDASAPIVVILAPDIGTLFLRPEVSIRNLRNALSLVLVLEELAVVLGLFVREVPGLVVERVRFDQTVCESMNSDTLALELLYIVAK